MKIRFFYGMLLLVCLETALLPHISQAGQPYIPGISTPSVTAPAVNQLPVSPNYIQGIDPSKCTTTQDNTSGSMTIYQNQPQAIINWQSFNIGQNATVYFNQQGNSSWIALNRIYDQNPTLIFGALKADGQIYLINQNGIIFSPGSKVDVNTLVASALNIKDADFLNGTLNFTQDPSLAYDPTAWVSNYGEITAQPGGAVFLLGPNVENGGIINAIYGQIGLAAGTIISLDQGGTRTALIVDLSAGGNVYGQAANRSGGQLIADMGLAGMYGGVVNQDGLIRSVSAINLHGQIELIAQSTIETGSGSVIESPISSSTDTTTSGTAAFQGGTVQMNGDFQRPDAPRAGYAPALIELYGAIDAPSGTVNINAGQRVYLAAGSTIDVSGIWSEEPATANIISVKLDSVVLADAYGQKGGLLQDQTITFNILTGSSIGNVSQDIINRPQTATELGIQGGTININSGDSSSGDIIVMPGAALNFSGGGINYDGGYVQTTKLLAGNKIYDISDAPLYLQYDAVLDSTTYTSFGISQTYTGTYAGGAPLTTYVPAYQKGGNAGLVNLVAKTVVLDGTLDGSVTPGFYQTNRTLSGSYSSSDDYLNALALSQAQGLETPTGGTLVIGQAPASDPTATNHIVQEIVISGPQSATPLPANFGPTDTLNPSQITTTLNADILNKASLGSLYLYANTAITIEDDARIVVNANQQAGNSTLSEGGNFTAVSPNINVSGEIIVPAGQISLTTLLNMITTSVPDGQSSIYLAPGSLLDVSGEKIDNSLAGKLASVSVEPGRSQGGSIVLEDQTDLNSGVLIMAGATLNVSGGYIIDTKGKVTGGSAGSLAIQGETIMLNQGAVIQGYALADPAGRINGGSITLSTGEIDVTTAAAAAAAWPTGFTAGSDIPTGLQGELFLAGDRFVDTGFTQITLQSLSNITVEPGVVVLPSLVRLKTPQPGSQQGVAAPATVLTVGEDVAGNASLIRLDDTFAYQAGATSFTAIAGSVLSIFGNQNTSADITVSPGAAIQMTPGGTITLTAPAVNMAGVLEAPGGNISITAKTSDLTLTGNILAAGYLQPDTSTMISGYGYNYIVHDGGSVSLSAGDNLDLASGSLIDISGSPVADNHVSLEDLNGNKIITYEEAGNAGSLTLNYGAGLTWAGNVNAQTNMAGLHGGALTVSSSYINVTAQDIQQYTSLGFDDLTLRGKYYLQFSGTMNETIGRELTLDTPEIIGSGSVVNLQAPWIVLENTNRPMMFVPAATGDGKLTLASTGWIDLMGSVNLSGFNTVNLLAANDIRLFARYYNTTTDNSPAPNIWGGELSTTGDLVLQASRIYPMVVNYGNTSKILDLNNNLLTLAVGSNYTIQSTGGQVTVLPVNNPVNSPIYSAGGQLNIEAYGGIDISGILEAPMGSINLTTSVNGNPAAPDSRIYLDAGSLLTTAGQGMVYYGGIDSNDNWVQTWVIRNQTTGQLTETTTNPGMSITINAPQVITRSGSTIDASAGSGSLFAYQFEPGIEGTSNPLAQSGLYIILPNNSEIAPGNAVYLEGGGGLAAGLYSLLPASQYGSYAFLPGAYVIELQNNMKIASGQNLVNNYGYPVIAGYQAVLGTGIQSTSPQAYAVMPAADILSRGNFTDYSNSQTLGDAGNIAITGTMVVIEGSLKAAALDSSYNGGSISLNAQNISVVSSTDATIPQLPANFNFNTSFDDPGFSGLQNFEGKMTVTDASISGNFQEINLGNAATTSTVTIESGAKLQASVISLAAQGSIDVEGGGSSQIPDLYAVAGNNGGEGVINLTTPGQLLIQSGALLRAANNMVLDVNDVGDIQGTLLVDAGVITFKNQNIFFGNSGKTSGDVGLYFTPDLWSKFDGFKDISLVAASEIQFSDNFTLNAQSSLTLDAQEIVGTTAGTEVSLNAPVINLQNSSGAASTAPAVINSAGSINFNAADGTDAQGNAIKSQINVSGNVLFGGFTTVSLNSGGDVVLMGKGSLTTGNADLNINAARITTTSTSTAVTNADGTTSMPITAADFIIYTGANAWNDMINNPNPAPATTNTITITNSGGTQGASSTPGGTLEFWAKTINQGGIIQVDGGAIKLTALGADSSDGIFLSDGAKILATGTASAPGGMVTLQANNGCIDLATGSSINVSAGAQGDAGMITLQAPAGGVTVGNGSLLGAAQGGAGGSLTLDTYQLSDMAMTNLIGTLAQGGFTDSLDITARQGNIDIAAGQTLQASHVKLTADDNSSGNGQINVYGAINADTADGSGLVELYAMNDLNIGNLTGGSGMVSARGTSGTANGGYVLLSSTQGYVNVNAGGTVNVSGGSSGINGGTLYLRALRNGEDVNINLNGTITGASAVYAEAFKTYNYATTTQSQWIGDAESYYNNNTAISRLGNAVANFHLLPGIELDSSGDINWNEAWDQGNKVSTQTRFGAGNDPGVLTLRAAGNLNINSNLVDHPTPLDDLPSSAANSPYSSWGFNLVAGADMSSADYLAVIKGQPASTANLNIAGSAVVYTENAPINFASGNDTLIGTGSNPGYMINTTDGFEYSIASYSGDIEGYVGRNLSFIGGAIQTATGNIGINIGGDLILQDMTRSLSAASGSIRTTGETTDGNIEDYWSYAGGGDITLVVGGNVGVKEADNEFGTFLNDQAWDRVYGKTSSSFKWAASYESTSVASYIVYGSVAQVTLYPTAGLATMAGGDLTVRTGGDFLSQAGTFGAGNLAIYSGGNIEGRFLNDGSAAETGQMHLSAMGSFGSVAAPQQIELANSEVYVTAQGDIELATVANPTIANPNFYGRTTGNSYYWYCTYTENSAINLNAGGDVIFTGASPFWTYNKTLSGAITGQDLTRILPATVDIVAGGSIQMTNSFYLAPAANGNLYLDAGGDINNINTGDGSSILISDMLPANWYTPAPIRDIGYSFARSIVGNNVHEGVTLQDGVDTGPGDVPLHADDSTPVVVNAGGNIINLNLTAPKETEITAGGNIQYLTYSGQNINPDDISLIRAAGNIILQDQSCGIQQAGPGVLLVQAGNYIDLGFSQIGIMTIGNKYNPLLPEDGSSLIILSGYSEDVPLAADVTATLNNAQNFFAALRNEVMSGDSYDVSSQKARTDIIDPQLGATPAAGDGNKGNIDMTSSQMSSNAPGSDIFIMASGAINVGKSTFFSAVEQLQQTGIYTSEGGAINIFAGGDVNVNESRVITFYGGDITIWSDDGNINAGRGAKEIIITQPPKKVTTTTSGVTTTYLQFSPPSVGSGIRAVTYSMDGNAAIDPPPLAGNIYPHAEIIDAGEAGIVGRNIYVQAQQVVNAGNISGTESVVGVPAAASGTSNIGTLSGSNAATQGSQLMSDISGIGAVNTAASQMIDDIIAKWLDVKVIDFDLNDQG